MPGPPGGVRAPRRYKAVHRSLAFDDAIAHDAEQVNRLAGVTPGEAVEDPVHGLELPSGRLPVVRPEEAVGEEVVVIGSKPRPLVLRGPDGMSGGRSDLFGNGGRGEKIARVGFALIPGGHGKPRARCAFG